MGTPIPERRALPAGARRVLHHRPSQGNHTPIPMNSLHPPGHNPAKRQSTPIVSRRGLGAVPEARQAYPWAKELNMIREEEDDDDDDPLARWLAFKRLDTVRETKANLFADDSSDSDTSDDEDEKKGHDPAPVLPPSDDVKVEVKASDPPPAASAGAGAGNIEQLSRFSQKLRQQTEHPRLQAVVTHPAFTWTMALATFWALFGTDFLKVTTDRNTDVGNGVVMFIIMFMFIFELAAFSLVRGKDYMWTFFFWMDVLAIVSLIPEWLVVFDVSTASLDSLTLARAGRAARAASRTARLARMVKAVQLIGREQEKRNKRNERYTWLESRNNNNEPVQPLAPAENHDELQVERLQERKAEKSVVGEHVLKLLFENIFVIVLVMFVVFTLVEPVLVTSKEVHHAEVSVGELQTVVGTPQYTSVQNYFFSNNDNLLFLKLNNAVVDVSVLGNKSPDDFRDDEVLSISCGDGCEAKFDYTSVAKSRALASLLGTIFVILLLIVGSAMVHNNINEVLIKPIERMVAIIKVLAINPLATLKPAEDFEFETGLVESMLVKIGALLQLGFGAAGASIIAENLSSSGALVPLSAGYRVEAIYVHIQVGEFGRFAQALGSNVIVFVNKVALVVHDVAAAFGGFPQQNNNDGTFTFVWQLPRKNKYTDDQYRKLAAETADAALVAMNKMLRQATSSKDIRSVFKDVPGCPQLQLRAGVHSGWSIAGAIGSSLKVDPSYVSGHVMLSHLLQRRAFWYDTSTLLSASFRNMLSANAQSQLVLVDRVLTRVLPEPVDVYALRPRVSKKAKGAANEDAVAKWAATLEQGVHAYIDGKWDDATAKLQTAASSDVGASFGPGAALQRFMKQHSNTAPAEWKGYRSDGDVKVKAE